MRVTEPPPPTSTIAQPGKRAVCTRFERAPVDLGFEHATSLALGGTETCVISDGKLVCLARSRAAPLTVRMTDVLHVAASGRRVCALRSNAVLDCFDDGTPFDFTYLTHTSGALLRHATDLVLDDDTLTLVEDDGSLRGIKIDVGTDASGRIVRVGFPGPASPGPVRAVTIARQIGGSARCALVGDHETCSAWRVHQTMDMPGPVAAIGGHCALLEDGRVACFSVRPLQLGAPVVVATLSHASAVASDDGQGGCAIVEGRWSCFGDLGLVFTVAGVGPFERPTTIPTPEDVTELSMLDGRACARTKSGRVSCFGCLEP